MNLVTDAVKKLEALISGSGCDDSTVVLLRRPDAPVCQYVGGVNLECQYGGLTAHVVTNYPVQATTRVSFMYGAELDTPQKRTAACAIMNAITNFLCISKGGHACLEKSHMACFLELHKELDGASLYCNGTMPHFQQKLAPNIVDDPDDADIILVSGDGFFTDEGNEIIERYRDKKRMIFIGPTAVGVATLLGLEHWCPYAR
jgi:hypothetical protein